MSAQTSSRKLNPLANAVEIAATFVFRSGSVPPETDETTLTVQPRVPFPLTRDWRVISRSNVALTRLPASAVEVADVDASFFLTPARTTTWVWGVGPLVQIPTSTDAAAAEKWSVGPTAALMYVNGPWTNGVVVGHRWSAGGPRTRADVRRTQIELQFSYSFSNGWYIDTNPTASHDWLAPAEHRWTVPIGLDVGRAIAAGSHEISLQFGAYYGVVRPAGTAGWAFGPQFAWVQ